MGLKAERKFAKSRDKRREGKNAFRVGRGQEQSKEFFCQHTFAFAKLLKEDLAGSFFF